MLWPCSAAAANVLSSILAVPVCCGPSMADESSSYIEVGPFSNSRRTGRGASLTVGVLMQRTPPCLGDSIWAPLRSPRPSKPRGHNPPDHQSDRATILTTRHLCATNTAVALSAPILE